MDFFLKVPLAHRFGQRLYVNTLRDRVFTGNIAPLARIPLAGIGDWSGREGLKAPKSTLKKWTRRLRSPGRAWELLTNPHAGSLTDVFTRLYGEGLVRRRSTVADALAIFRTDEKLPTAALSVIEPFMDHPLAEVSFLALNTVITLGEIIAQDAR